MRELFDKDRLSKKTSSKKGDKVHRMTSKNPLFGRLSKLHSIIKMLASKGASVRFPNNSKSPRLKEVSEIAAAMMNDGRSSAPPSVSLSPRFMALLEPDPIAVTWDETAIPALPPQAPEHKEKRWFPGCGHLHAGGPVEMCAHVNQVHKGQDAPDAVRRMLQNTCRHPCGHRFVASASVAVVSRHEHQARARRPGRVDPVPLLAPGVTYGGFRFDPQLGIRGPNAAKNYLLKFRKPQNFFSILRAARGDFWERKWDPPPS